MPDSSWKRGRKDGNLKPAAEKEGDVATKGGTDSKGAGGPKGGIDPEVCVGSESEIGSK